MNKQKQKELLKLTPSDFLKWLIAKKFDPDTFKKIMNWYQKNK